MIFNIQDGINLVYRMYHYLLVLDLVYCKIIDILEDVFVRFYELLVYR